jgi:sulfur relay (sulfurtransferase) DsrF/TusC family protein
LNDGGDNEKEYLPLVSCLRFSIVDSGSFRIAKGQRHRSTASSDRDNETINELLLFWDEKDLYVETATRHEKKISQVAEDMTVITAKEIEDMNAHTGSFKNPLAGNISPKP